MNQAATQTTHDQFEPLDRATIEALLSRMGELAAEQGMRFEIAIYGGSALALMFPWRDSTFDVDYMPIEGAAEELGELANQALADLGLPPDRLRDDVRMFESIRPEYRFNAEYPKGCGARNESGLRVMCATPEYLLAMKLMSMRSSLESRDAEDVWYLMDACGITSEAEATEVVEAYYPGDEVPELHMQILADLLSAKAQGVAYDPMLAWHS